MTPIRPKLLKERSDERHKTAIGRPVDPVHLLVPRLCETGTGTGGGLMRFLENAKKEWREPQISITMTTVYVHTVPSSQTRIDLVENEGTQRLCT